MTTENQNEQASEMTESTSEALLRILLAAKGFIGDFPEASELADILDNGIKLDRILVLVDAISDIQQKVNNIQTKLDTIQSEQTAYANNANAKLEEMNFKLDTTNTGITRMHEDIISRFNTVIGLLQSQNETEQ